jgi:hypothetical protein
LQRVGCLLMFNSLSVYAAEPRNASAAYCKY